MTTRQQLEQQLVAAHRSGNVQAAQQAAYNIRAYDTAIARGGSGFDWNVPSVNAPPPIERVPKPTFGSWLENVGIGIGEGLGEQVQGIGELAQRGVSALGAYAKDPLKASAAAFMGALAPAMRGFTQPAQVAKDVGAGVVETGKQMYQQATSGPVGLGTVIGQNLDLPGPSGQRRPTMAELDVYHGTPHTFEPEEGAPLGRFRSEKIGTGEGAQAYGYGLYLAEDKQVGEGYRRTLSNFEQPYIKFGNKKIAGNQLSDTDLEALKYLEIGQRNAGQFPHNTVYYAKQAAANKPEVLQRLEEFGRDVKFGYEKNKGALYKVDLPDTKIEQMLDWDKPLSEQPKAFEIAKNVFNDPRRKQAGFPSLSDAEIGNLSGSDLYQAMTPTWRGGQKGASSDLRQLGIPGIKYLDAGSRDGGKGTRNFVVFPGEEQNLTILERDGVKAEVPKPKTPSFTDALNNLVRPDLEDDQVFSKPLPPADADNLDYVGKFGASSTGTGGMHVSVRDGIKNAGPHEFFFYDNNDEPLGFARLTKNKKQASINMIAFNEEGRGRGFGKSFYKYLLDDLGVEVKSDKEITQGTAGIYESLAKEYPTRVDDDGRVVISPKSK